MKVLSEKDIDSNRTVSNDICEIFEILGLGSLLFDLLTEIRYKMSELSCLLMVSVKTISYKIVFVGQCIAGTAAHFWFFSNSIFTPFIEIKIFEI